MNASAADAKQIRIAGLYSVVPTGHRQPQKPHAKQIRKEFQGLSEHTAPFDALVYVVNGAAEVAIPGEGHVVKAGEMIMMPANEPHALKAVERLKMALVMIRS